MHLHLAYQRWPAQHPERIQLYSMNTPNGIKVALALEEMKLAYEPHTINIRKGDQHTEAFYALNPNGKIPALMDPAGPDGHAINLMESGAILRYLADKTGEYTPLDKVGKSACDQWLFFQAAHIGPMFGQFGHFYVYAEDRCDHPYPLGRYSAETRRLLAVLEQHLGRHQFMLGDSYSIADMAICPWVECLRATYDASAHLQLDEFTEVERWLSSCIHRPAYSRARKVCVPDA